MANLDNFWFSMWLQPKATIKKVVATNPKRGFFFLAAIWFLQLFFLYESHYAFVFPSHWIITIIIAAIISPFLGAIAFYVFGWFLYIIGKVLKGKAFQLHVRCAFAWSRIPLILNLIMWFVIVLFSKELIFERQGIDISFVFINLVALATLIWSFVLLVLAIQEVQKFSLAKSILNVILAYFIVIIIFSIIIPIYLFFF